MKKILSLFGLSLLIMSCNKTNVITITGTEPVAGTVFKKNDVINVKGTIEASEKKIVSYSVKITNKTMGTDVFNEIKEANDKSVSYDESWTNNVTHHSDMMLIISATDKKDFTESDTTHFHCHPM